MATYIKKRSELLRHAWPNGNERVSVILQSLDRFYQVEKIFFLTKGMIK